MSLPRRKYIGVTQGLRGWFAVLYDADGPIQSGIGSYKTAAEAQSEAIDWSISDDIPLDFDVDEYLAIHKDKK